MVDIGSMVPKVSAAGILNGILWFCLVVMIIGGIGYYLWWTFKKKKYNQFKVVIWEKDSNGNVHEFYDRAGVFLDKQTGFKLLFLEKLKKGLNPNRIPYVSSKDKKGRLVKTVYLRKIGVSNYVFCEMGLPGTVEFTVGEEDLNWAAQDMERIRKTFGKEGWLQKMAPYIMFIITILIVMIVLISLFNKFTVLKEVSANMLEITKEQRTITEMMFNMTNGSIVPQNNIPIITPAGVR